MSSRGKTWWGQRFIAALEQQMDSGRLQRGRSYASPRRILSFEIDAKGVVSATVRGNINPYFGVTKEPRYQVAIQLDPIPAKARKTLIEQLGGRADLVSHLLMNEMPEGIDAAFAESGVGLLPRSEKDFKRTDCSCPDWANPCKHIAGVYYRLAEQLDHDPLLLFELRGLARNELRTELARTPLGQALAPLMSEDDQAPLEPVESLYPPLRPVADEVTSAAGAWQQQALDPQGFWRGRVPLPTEPEAATGQGPDRVSAVLVKKGGDFPPFWDRDQSFIAVMDELYRRIESKNRRLL
ncbi:MAG: SWIM zinc finger family protein [Lamprobacter sp.]|uniref:SWIM zinc finger family protein n=1 Tax=Lamprobacter sp. TaxID=3100796 RepID=UPI002B2624EC|nr:SWIM zinc finger family protein [Lamprobacter sp.]MEA3643287.1 SWIM zinc finger family protein [Lamprobacter sp.]